MRNQILNYFGNYKIIRELGHGGFGHVYLARDLELDRDVALKVLNTDLAREPAILRQFRREAKALGRLHHPNIVLVHSVQSRHFPPYIVMEYVDGITLEGYLQQGALSLSDALPILEQIALALDAAHRQGIVHRDVKPANVLITYEGRVKLTDFGLALIATDPTASQSNSAIGSVLYMAPEQGDINRQDEIGPATDIYALGIIAYQMLTGRVPFQGKDQYVVLAAHRNVPPPDPRAFGINLSQDLVNILIQTLAKEPSTRYQSASQFVNLLRKAISLDRFFEAPPWGEQERFNRLISSEAPTRQIDMGYEGDLLNAPVSTVQNPLYATLLLSLFFALCATVIALGHSWSAAMSQSVTLFSTTIEVTITEPLNSFALMSQATATPRLTGIATESTAIILATFTKIPVTEAYPLTPTPVHTKTATIIPTITSKNANATFIYTETRVPSQTPLATYTPLPTSTPWVTNTFVPTEIPTLTALPTKTPLPTTLTALPTKTPLPTLTALPTKTPLPTLTALPTKTPLPTLTALPTETPLPTLTALPTKTPLPTEPPASPTPALSFQAINMGADFSRGCLGHYIFGYIRDNAGTPLAGQRVLIYNEYGYTMPPTLSKIEPHGWYDVPISSDRSIWYIQLIDEADKPISTIAEILNTGNYLEGSEGCWHQVDFTQLNN